MSPDRQWNFDGVKTLRKKIDMTGSIDQHWGVVVHAVQLPANINEVERLALSQEGKPQRCNWQQNGKSFSSSRMINY